MQKLLEGEKFRKQKVEKCIIISDERKLKDLYKYETPKQCVSKESREKYNF
jgi:hypothetical protein